MKFGNQSLKTAKGILLDLMCECEQLTDDLRQRKNYDDAYMMCKLGDRMNFINYKMEIVNDLLKIINKAEAENLDLGTEINNKINIYYKDLIFEQEVGTDSFDFHNCADNRCIELICKWKDLCEYYTEYYKNAAVLPAVIDLKKAAN